MLPIIVDVGEPATVMCTQCMYYMHACMHGVGGFSPLLNFVCMVIKFEWIGIHTTTTVTMNGHCGKLAHI